MRAVAVKVQDWKGDGRAWVVVHHAGRRTVQLVGDDWNEARRLAREIETEYQRIRAGLPAALPVADVLERHLVEHVAHLKHSTRVLQTGIVRNHLVPALGELDVRDLDRERVQGFARAKLADCSPSFVRACVNVLRRAVGRLREDDPDLPDPATWRVHELVQRAETSTATEIRAVDSWTHDEAAKLLAIVKRTEPRYYPIVLTLLHTGMRRGEALGLQWQDVDVERGRIWIRRARVRSRTVTPKHRSPNDTPRSVRITPAMDAELRGLRTFRYRRSGGWVFASRNGTAMQETTLARAWRRLRPELARRDVRPLTMHSLRHTFATLSLGAGKSVKWVSGQLGHRDAATTLNVYAHALPDEETELGYLPGAGAVAVPSPGVTLASPGVAT